MPCGSCVVKKPEKKKQTTGKAEERKAEKQSQKGKRKAKKEARKTSKVEKQEDSNSRKRYQRRRQIAINGILMKQDIPWPVLKTCHSRRPNVLQFGTLEDLMSLKSRTRTPGWWLTYPSEKYEFVNSDDYSQYMEK